MALISLRMGRHPESRLIPSCREIPKPAGNTGKGRVFTDNGSSSRKNGIAVPPDLAKRQPTKNRREPTRYIRHEEGDFDTAAKPNRSLMTMAPVVGRTTTVCPPENANAAKDLIMTNMAISTTSSTAKWMEARPGEHSFIRVPAGDMAIVQRPTDIILGSSAGDARATVVTGLSLRAAVGPVATQVGLRAHLMSDEAKAFVAAGESFVAHETLNHSSREYVRDAVQVNSAEGFNARVRRSELYLSIHKY